ncbi:MAG: PLP-dependent aspartate aminotransferase family protein [Candidatus Melainabacteria bacterium]|nr:PLP-dependent aspartate aminotransferase family protein [Candidatus Melainabacteria bacterium]
MTFTPDYGLPTADAHSSTTPGLQTRAIHSHQAPEPRFGAVNVPIYQTSTFAFESFQTHRGYDYSRCGNPTTDALAGALASLEGGRHGLVFASGLGALTTMLVALLKPGDHVVVEENVYGGTFRLLNRVMVPYQIQVTYVNTAQPEAVAQAIQENTRLVFLETPTNPMMKLADIAAIAKITQSRQVLLCVDNTFASPAIQQPLLLGADIVLHSTTKYVGGHSDVVGGALVVNDDALHETLQFHLCSLGASADPHAAWLTLRGLKTLGIRLERHGSNALQLARRLEQHPAVEQVIYPGLESHPQYGLACQQMAPDGRLNAGGMITLRLAGDVSHTKRFLESLRYFTLAESLGGVESLVCHPASMTHASVDRDVRLRLGITDSLVRLSVGIEAVADLEQDLMQALQNSHQTAASGV